MVISFWLLPGLDACPDAEDPSSSALSFDAATDDLGTDGVSPTEAAAADFSSRGLAASVPPVEMDEGRGGGGFGRAKGFEDGEQSGGDCFEGSNAIGSIRNILQVTLANSHLVRSPYSFSSLAPVDPTEDPQSDHRMVR